MGQHMGPPRLEPKGKSNHVVLLVAVAAAVCVAVFMIGIVFAAFFFRDDIAKFAGLPSREEARESRAAQEGLLDHIDQMEDRMFDEEGVPVVVEELQDTTPRAGGELGQIERVTKEFLNEVLVHRNEYVKQLEGARWDVVLDVDRLWKDKDDAYSESRAMIQAADDAVDELEKKIRVTLASVPQRVRALNISENKKEEYITGFQESAGKSDTAMERNLALEREVFGTVGDLVDFLEKNDGEWTVEEGEILFYTDEMVEQYNAYLERIAEIVAEQEQIQQASMNRARGHLEN